MDAQQQQAPPAPPVDAPASEAPPAPPAQPEGEAPSDGRQPEAPAYAALRPQLSTLGRQRKAATDALGLDKDATPEEIQTAIEALKRPRPQSLDPAVELPAEIIEEQRRLHKRAWQSAERDFGEEMTLQAQGLQELVANTDDPYELTQALAELAQSAGTPAAPSGEEPAPPAGEQPAAPAQQPPGVDAEVGQPGWKVTADEDDEKGSGDTRGFFQKVLGAKP